MATYLCNAFSFNMVAAQTATIKMREITREETREYLLAPEECWGGLGHTALDPRVRQAVGHADTCGLFAHELDIAGIAPARVNVALEKGDDLIVGQYSGPRLPEGATTLPEGASIRWLLVTIE
ncbi:MAG: DUF1874 domain-containing protein [Candidatus Nanopelagicales bacterium]|nr:DUF1874 domain-containing protein [Candidatus Nanopelagicales bacterium]